MGKTFLARRPDFFYENGRNSETKIRKIDPNMTKYWGEARKMTHSSETEFFWGGGLNGKVVAPGILVICPVDKNRNYHTKK